MIRRLFPAILLLAGLTACQDLLTNPFSERQAQSLSLTSLDQGFFSDIDTAAHFTISSQRELSAFWKDLGGNKKVPEVDFDHETVLAATMGGRSSSGYIVEVKEVAIKEDKVQSTVVETSPGASCGVLAVITSPYHVVKINAVVSEVEFVVEERVHECE